VKEPVWVLRSVVEAVHEAQLAEHGGASGIRDAALLDSALARPLNLRAYSQSDICMLAAAYAFGLVRNHPFVDGKKRTAFLVAYVFLRLNGLDLTASETNAVEAMLALASGDVKEDEFAIWLRSNTTALADGV
jgi:death-on-curing protein